MLERTPPQKPSKRNRSRRWLANLTVSALLASTVTAVGQGYYTDIPRDHWALPAVNALSDRGVLLGNPDGTFDGEHRLSRFEMAVILHRLLAVQDETGQGQAEEPPLLDMAEALDRLDKLEESDEELFELLSDIVTTQTIEVSAMFNRIQQLEKQMSELHDKLESGELRGPPGPKGPPGPPGPPGPEVKVTPTPPAATPPAPRAAVEPAPAPPLEKPVDVPAPETRQAVERTPVVPAYTYTPPPVEKPSEPGEMTIQPW